jgi:hypothetical protein
VFPPCNHVQTGSGAHPATIQCILGVLSLGIKWPGCEADRSPSPSAEVKNAWSYTSTPPLHLHGVMLT